MKPAWILLVLLALAAFPQAAPATPSGIQRATQNGQTYFRASDWALARGMDSNWVVRDKSLQLAGSAVCILLTGDSLEIQFNGTSVFLSYPIIVQKGAFYLSQLDAEMVLEPLVNPPRLPADGAD